VKKKRVAEGEGVVLKMTMNSTMLIKSYGVVLRCQVIDIIVMFSDPDPVFLIPPTKPIHFPKFEICL
jgi:hypothetical protein